MFAVYFFGGDIHFPINLVGAGTAVQAARIALTKQGSAYVWGLSNGGAKN